MIRLALAVPAVLACLATSAVAQRPDSSGLAGQWAITIGTPENPEYRTIVATVDAKGTIRGTLGSPMGAVPIDSGRVTGARFTLHATLGTGLHLSYEGIVSHDSLHGTWVYDGSEGRFAGLRGTTPPSAPPVAPKRSPAQSRNRDLAVRQEPLEALRERVGPLPMQRMAGLGIRL